MTNELQALLDYADELHQKHLLSESTDPFAYDPGKTEHLDQYDGVFEPESKTLTIFTEVMGLRYEDRSRHLEKLAVSDSIVLRRDSGNPYNSNNFELFRNDGKTLGTLPRELCNRLAPLYDTNAIRIIKVQASYIEQFNDRSRYVKQGVLFVQIELHILHSAICSGT